MSYQERRDRLAESLRLGGGGEIRLGKATSNLFRDRGTRGDTLDVSDFQHVLSVDPHTRVIETEGMVTYEALADAALTHGLMPAVVPQLKSITIGGAIGGIRSQSPPFP